MRQIPPLASMETAHSCKQHVLTFEEKTNYKHEAWQRPNLEREFCLGRTINHLQVFKSIWITINCLSFDNPLFMWSMAFAYCTRCKDSRGFFSITCIIVNWKIGLWRWTVWWAKLQKKNRWWAKDYQARKLIYICKIYEGWTIQVIFKEQIIKAYLDQIFDFQARRLGAVNFQHPPCFVPPEQVREF